MVDSGVIWLFGLTQGAWPYMQWQGRARQQQARSRPPAGRNMLEPSSCPWIATGKYEQSDRGEVLLTTIIATQDHEVWLYPHPGLPHRSVVGCDAKLAAGGTPTTSCQPTRVPCRRTGDPAHTSAPPSPPLVRMELDEPNLECLEQFPVLSLRSLFTPLLNYIYPVPDRMLPCFRSISSASRESKTNGRSTSGSDRMARGNLAKAEG